MVRGFYGGCGVCVRFMGNYIGFHREYIGFIGIM